jgi:NAD(P)-dependent dehydrogenase (short-subunit alcohol dehydrogenase family)
MLLDVAKASDWTEAIEFLSQQGFSIDGLVNNAGINVKYPPIEMPDEEWDRCMDTNLRGAWYGARAVLPQMIARGSGSIVNIASVHAHAIIPASFPYPVAKHGLIGLTRALGVEYARCGVRVNAISPGYVDTALVRDWWNAQQDPAAAERATRDLIPAGRIAEPREVAMAAVFLLSDEAPSINAAVLPIDGGALAQLHP